MGQFFEQIPDSLVEWIKEQRLFFVATAPRSDSGHVNVSPKGHDTFRVVSPTSAWYLDLSGSGNETISHLQENGRITIMFAAFEGPPRIMRLFGTGKIIERGTRQFEDLLANEPERLTTYSGQRSIIWIDIHKVGTSCGYSVPFYEYKQERDTLLKFMAKREESDAAGRDDDGLRAYWKKKNSESIDGLPGYRIQPISGSEGSTRLRVFDAAQQKVAASSSFATGLAVGMAASVLGFMLFRDFVEPRLGLV
ncbi:hypothetical protein ACM66B_004246 [Microbotryomycetes sp. NB124-2]